MWLGDYVFGEYLVLAHKGDVKVCIDALESEMWIQAPSAGLGGGAGSSGTTGVARCPAGSCWPGGSLFSGDLY